METRINVMANTVTAAKKPAVATCSSLTRWGWALSARGWPQSEQISMVLVRPTLVTMRPPHFVQDKAAAPTGSTLTHHPSSQGFWQVYPLPPKATPGALRY